LPTPADRTMIPTGVESNLSSVRIRQSTGKAWFTLAMVKDFKAGSIHCDGHCDTDKKHIRAEIDVDSAWLVPEFVIQAPGNGTA
jgi:hypothetical protein